MRYIVAEEELGVFLGAFKNHGVFAKTDIFGISKAFSFNTKEDAKEFIDDYAGEKKDTWIYIERILTKGKYHKLGQHVLKANNVLILDFNKYGVLVNKKLLNKDEINNIKFSKNETDNELAQKSFIENFLQSIKQKMYSNRK